MVDPELKVLRLENSVVYHLLWLTEKEKLEREKAEAEAEIVGIKSVDINEADTYLKQGYELKDTYAKTVTLIKKENTNNEES